MSDLETAVIKQAEAADSIVLTNLALKLWPAHAFEELKAELEKLLSIQEAAFFLAFTEESAQAVGFAQCQLRRDYVEGTTSSPVGYLEGIFVEEEARGRGIAEVLLLECERWAKDRGCVEFASDCEMENKESLAFHSASGFQEVNRIVCFVKKI